MQLRAICGLTLGLLLAGCAGQEATAPARQAAGTSGTPSAFDGTWQGSGQLTATRPGNCGEPVLNRSMQVRNGMAQLNYEIRTNTVFSGTVGADGSLEMQSGNRVFRGRFAGDSFTGQYFHPSCPRDWTMRRVATAQPAPAR